MKPYMYYKDEEGNGIRHELSEADLKVVEAMEFDRMMWEFLTEVATRPGDTEWYIVMNTNHQKWLRVVHQKYQRAGLYRGGKKPSLLGVSITINESVQVPTLE